MNAVSYLLPKSGVQNTNAALDFMLTESWRFPTTTASLELELLIKYCLQKQKHICL